MAKVPSVPVPVWKKLYAAMSKFAALQPWERFEDSELFAVQDPVTKKMGYACFLGALGEVLALCVYRGAAGLAVHQRMQRGEIDQATDDIFAVQDALMAECSEREFLKKPDRKIIEKLGLRFQGRKAWPLFRSHLPGHFPWQLNEDEAVFLTFALQCACDAVIQSARGTLKLIGPSGQVFSYFPQEGKKSPKAGFETHWEPYPAYRREPSAPLELPGERIDALKARTLKQDGPWETQAFFVPAPILDRDRPYFARYLMVAHAESGFIFDAAAVAPEKAPHQALAETLLGAMEKSGFKPSKLYVLEDSLATALAPLSKAMALPIKAKRPLPAIDEARRGLQEAMAAKKI